MIRRPHPLLSAFFFNGEAWLYFPPQAGSSWSGAVWCARWEGGVYSPFSECLEEAPFTHILTQTPVAGRKNIPHPQALPKSGTGGPQTSAVRLESQAQLLSPQCVIHPGGLLSVA